MPRQAAYCIIALADRPSRRPLWDSICGDLLPSSLCRAGKQENPAVKEGVLDADINHRRIEMGASSVSPGGVG